jgi:hypothetical protein
MLTNLAYVSTRKPTCTDQEIEKILASCKKNNPPLDITGVLLYSENRFIQYVEGESKELMALYDKVKKDDRHEKVFMISYSPIKEKIFPGWHMGSKKFSASEVDFKTVITKEEKDVFKSLIDGEEQDGTKVRGLLLKFFKKM